jgi:dolichyl-phosphate-mannose-protein mannosyltransferase
VLSKLHKLKSWQVAYLMAVLGLAVFIIGFNNPFQGDDSYQIVNNVPVHSISNIFLFFRSSTFFNGGHLTGIYYRPLMTTVFSLLYTLFGPHPLAFHIFQFAIYLASAYLVYLIFRYFFKTVLALVLALIFLVHPLNSQVVFAIPSMQDALFFFFGIASLWLLIFRKSFRSLCLVALCLFLSLLSKETAVVFVVIDVAYLLWFNRQRVSSFIKVIILPLVLYLVLKIHAVGLNSPQLDAPIDKVHLIGRLLTDPSIVLFYVTKFIFPWRLATDYYWTYPTFSVSHVLLPALIDLAVVGLFVYGGVRVHRKFSANVFHGYLFFGLWAVIGLLPYMQIIPLDLTACETWFYFSMVGVLGMIGLSLLTIKVRIQPIILIVVAIVLILALGMRTAIRGTDYRSQYILALADLSGSSQDFSAMNNVAEGLIEQANYPEAAVYAKRSVSIFPNVTSLNNLGVALEYEENYPGAVAAYNQALKYGNLSFIYENLAELTLVYGRASDDTRLYQVALTKYPHDSKIWLYLAILEDATGAQADAKVAVANAAKYGPIPQALFNDISDGKPFNLQLPIAKTTLQIK